MLSVEVSVTAAAVLHLLSFVLLKVWINSTWSKDNLRIVFPYISFSCCVTNPNYPIAIIIILIGV